MFLWLSHRTIANSAERKIVNISSQVPLIEDSQIIIPIIIAIDKSIKPVIRNPLLSLVTPCVHVMEDMAIKAITPISRLNMKKDAATSNM